jgi:hypothetical protein
MPEGLWVANTQTDTQADTQHRIIYLNDAMIATRMGEKRSAFRCTY